MTKKPPALRDFLYLDAERVRSLLAQLEGGVVEEVAERLTKSGEARAGGRVFGLFDLGASVLREKSAEQTKSLQDALFMLFEAAAEEVGVITAPEPLGETAAWEKAVVHDLLKPGQIVKLTAPTRILDSRHFRARAERFARWPRLVTGFAHQDALAAIKSPKDRERKLNQLVAQEVGGEPVIDMIRGLGEFVELFMAGTIGIRQFPCGLEFPAFAFVGTLLDRTDFLQEERDALFGKYGSSPSEWTHVFQVASIPAGNEPATTDEIDASGLVDEVSGRVSRDKFEELCISMLRMMETAGIAEAPTFPAISVTPLALYREVPTPG